MRRVFPLLVDGLARVAYVEPTQPSGEVGATGMAIVSPTFRLRG